MVQLILLMMLDVGILGMSEGRAVKKPSNYLMTAQNALRTWNCLLFATQTHLVHPMLECWDIAHPVSVQSSCWSFSCLWALFLAGLKLKIWGISCELILTYVREHIFLDAKLSCNWHPHTCQVHWKNNPADSRVHAKISTIKSPLAPSVFFTGR